MQSDIYMVKSGSASQIAENSKYGSSTARAHVTNLAHDFLAFDSFPDVYLGNYAV